MNVKLAPSILAADFAHLAEEAARVQAGGADLLHVDVMDGHFVPNLTLGPAVVSALKRASPLPLDGHLMILDPDRDLAAFIEAGVSMVSVHVEVLPHLHRTLTRIRELGAKAGVAINPSTPVAVIGEVLEQLDYVLVMSVNPGFAGQPFIARSIQKIAELRALLSRADRHIDIEVDGGVDAGNAHALVQAGATILVAGSAVFDGRDPAAAARTLRQAAMGRG